MKHSSKLLVNIITSYVRIFVTAITSLIATRIALEQLGASDFGIYNLTSGVIVMMSFLSGALAISAQRFYSIHIGSGDSLALSDSFNSSFGIHLFIGLFSALLQLSILPFIFRYWLNIPSNEINAAESVFLILIITSSLTLIFIPYTAIINAREDLSIWAISDMIANILRLGAAYALEYTDDKLIVYGILMGLAQVIKIAIEYIWSRIKYHECNLHLRKLYNKRIWHQMLGFVGWNTLGSIAVIARNQGLAIVLNIFFGTIANAAYGVANQVNSFVLSFATTITAVFSPSIIQSYSKGEIKKMVSVANLSSKLSFYLSGAMALPILIFLTPIIRLWLKDVPEYTDIFVELIVMSFLIQQMYPGFNRIIYAVGDIKWYQIWMSILLVSNIPIGCVLFLLGTPAYTIFIAMLFLQIAVLILTMQICHKITDINLKDYYFKNTIQIIILIFIVLCGKYFSTKFLGDCVSIENIILFSVVIEILYLGCFIFTDLSTADRNYIRNTILSKIKLR